MANEEYIIKRYILKDKGLEVYDYLKNGSFEETTNHISEAIRIGEISEVPEHIRNSEKYEVLVSGSEGFYKVLKRDKDKAEGKLRKLELDLKKNQEDIKIISQNLKKLNGAKVIN